MNDISMVGALLEAFDNANEGVAIWDDNDDLLGYNKKYENIFFRNMLFKVEKGINFKEAYKKALSNPKKILKKEDAELRIALREDARKTKTPVSREAAIEGSVFNVKETPSNNGHIITFITEVTEQKHLEQMQSRLSNAIDAIPSHLMFWDQNEKLVRVNSLAREQNKLEGVELLEGMSYSEFLKAQFRAGLYNTPRDFSVTSFIDKRIEERKGLTSKSSKIKYKNGRTFIRTENKLPDGGILTLLNDISELEKKEENEKLLSRSLDNMSYGVQVWDKDQRLVNFNAAIKRKNKSLGIKTEIGMTWEESLKDQVDNGFYDINKKDKDAWVKKGVEYFNDLKGEGTQTYSHKDNTHSMVTSKRLEDGSILQVVSDVTYLKAQEKDLKRVYDAIENIPNGAMIWNNKDELVFANKVARDVQAEVGFKLEKGLKREALVKNSIEKNLFSFPEGINNVSQYLKSVNQKMNENADGYASSFGNEKGSWIATNKLLEGGDYIQIYNDVTEIKRKEMELSRLRDGIDQMPDGLMVWGEEGKLVYANKIVRDVQATIGFEIKPGVNRLDMLRNNVKKGLSDYGMSVEEYQKQFLSNLSAAGDAGISSELKMQFEGEESVFISTAFKLKNGDWIQTLKNISDIKKREEELKRVTDAIEIIPNGIVIWDSQHKLTFFNKFAAKIMEAWGCPLKLGLERKELVNKLISTGSIKLSADQNVNSYIENSLAAMKGNDTGYNIETSNYGVHLLVNNVALETGEYVGVYSDITEIKNKQGELDRLMLGMNQVKGFALAAWSKEDKLIYANDFMREFSQKVGFDLVPGVTRLDFIKSQFAKGSLSVEHKTPEAYLSWFNNEMDKDEDGFTFEIDTYDGENRFHNQQSARRVSSGDYFQIITDITQVKQQQKELERLYDGINKMGDPVIIWDSDNILVFCNEAAKRRNKNEWDYEIKPGVRRADMLRHLMKKGLRLADNLSVEEHMGIQKGRMIEREEGITVETKMGETTFISTSKMLGDGGFIQNFTDISQLKKHEEQIALQKERYSRVLGDLNSIVFDSNLETRRVTYEIPENLNSEWGDLAQAATSIEATEDFYSFVREDYRDAYKKAFKDLVKGQTDAVRIEHLNKTQDGNEIWYETRAKAVFEKGKAARIIGLVENINERKALELKVKKAQQQVYDAINNIEGGVILWSEDDKVILINSYMKKLTGEELDEGIHYRELIGVFIRNGLLQLDDQDPEEWIEERLIARRKVTGFEEQTMPPMKNGRSFKMSGRRLPDKTFIQIFTDVTDLKTRESELERIVNELNEAKEQADGANKAKSQFLANMSHELRTPLNAVIGLTEMLKEDAEDDGNDDYLEPLERIHGASKHLLNLINDVLDLSKIEAGKVELYNENFSLPAMLEEVAETSRTLVEQKSNKLLLNIEPSITFINADVTRTKQIVLNLISNAAKFCENGEISIDVKGQNSSKRKLIQIDVKDSGIGMTQEQIDKLFQAFTQADASTTRKYGGTGLGLTIVQNLARLMGGGVSVQSQLGEGTTFSVTIQDIEVEETSDVKAEDLESLNRETALVSKKDGKSTILVIDDDPTIRDLMTRHLEKNNFSVLKALDGAQGIKMAREYRPDAITLDILMPEMDGWSVLRTLKADKEVAHIPVVMASIIDEKKKGFSLGAADYLSKPVERDRLIGSIGKLLGSKTGKVIMIVEDNEDLRFTIKEALIGAEYLVLEAGNGKEALDILDNEASKTPDLILLDLMMPKMNGFEFLESYRKEYKQQAPVVVITGADLDKNDKEFLSSETTRVIEKSSMTDIGIADQLVQTIASVARGNE